MGKHKLRERVEAVVLREISQRLGDTPRPQCRIFRHVFTSPIIILPSEYLRVRLFINGEMSVNIHRNFYE